MPIEIGAEIRDVSRAEFSEVCYEVMGRVFAIRREMGRFFNECVYQRRIRDCFDGTLHEVPIYVRHCGFCKRYAMDSLFRAAAIFEWKSVETLCDTHRAQLLHYLMLCDVNAGKLVNLRPEKIEHEFVNVAIERTQRQSPEFDATGFLPTDKRDQDWVNFLCDAIRDWGTGLEQGLYQSASDFFYGGPEIAVVDAEVVCGNAGYGKQSIRANESGDVLIISTVNQRLKEFQRHCQLFLENLDRDKLHWLNISLHRVTATTLLKMS